MGMATSVKEEMALYGVVDRAYSASTVPLVTRSPPAPTMSMETPMGTRSNKSTISAMNASAPIINGLILFPPLPPRRRHGPGPSSPRPRYL